MLNFYQSPSGFDPQRYPKLQTAHACPCTWPQLVWAILTVGKGERATRRSTMTGYYAAFEAVYKASMVYASLQQNPIGNYLMQTSIYKDLDPSEKGAISYYLGLMSAKLLAAKYLQVAWLIHLQRYEKANLITVTQRINPGTGKRDRSRPDLIGATRSSEWIVMEAKGRSGTLTNGETLELFKKMDQQLTIVSSIKGMTPLLRVASASQFGTDDAFRIDWSDPDEVDQPGVDLQFTLSDLLEAYYRPFAALLNDGSTSIDERTAVGDRYQVRLLNDVDVTVGINAQILRALVSDELLSIPNILAEGLAIDGTTSFEHEEPEFRIALQRDDQRETTTSPAASSVHIGIDGIYVELGRRWSSENMSRSVYDRPAIP